jgi:uncharacterized protein (TIGR03545 family)
MKSTQLKPKGWIRWTGLAGVIGLSLLIMGGLYFISGAVIKNQIEKTASEAGGAKVEIESIALGVDPLGVHLNKLALTDPEQPMQNLLVIDRLDLSLNLYHLVLNRWVIEDINIQGLAVNVARTESGALPAISKPQLTVSTTQSSSQPFEMPNLNLPSAEEVLNKQTFATLTEAQKLETRTEQVKQTWQTIEQGLPTEQTLAQYQQEIDEIFNGSIRSLEDLKQRQQQIKALQQRWAEDRRNLKEGQQFIQTETKALKQGVEQLVKLPEQDLDRVMQTYTLDEKGLSNISYVLFGESAQQQLNGVMEWYRKAQPFIDWLKKYHHEQSQTQSDAVIPTRSKGENVEFTEWDPQPSFMIKRINLDGELDWGKLAIQMTDVHADPSETNKPVKFLVRAQPQTQAQALLIQGQSTNQHEQQWITTAQANWQNYQINDWQLSSNPNLPVKLSQARHQFEAQARLQGLTALDLTLNLDYQNTDFDLSDATSKQIQRYIAPVFAEIDRFEVTAGLQGDITSPQFSARSDLDKRLRAGLRQVFDQELAQLRQQLKLKLKQKLADYQNDLEARLADYGLDQDKLKQAEAEIQNVEKYAEQKLKSAEQEVKQKLKRELEQREQEARQKFEQAEREAKARAQAVEQAAKQKAAEEKQRLEREAKQKLEQQLRDKLKF